VGGTAVLVGAGGACVAGGLFGAWVVGVRVWVGTAVQIGIVGWKVGVGVSLGVGEIVWLGGSVLDEVAVNETITDTDSAGGIQSGQGATPANPRLYASNTACSLEPSSSSLSEIWLPWGCWANHW